MKSGFNLHTNTGKIGVGDGASFVTGYGGYHAAYDLKNLNFLTKKKVILI